MALEVNEVSRLVAISGMKEMVETDLEHCCERGIRGDVAANTGVLLVLGMDHGQRVPADEALHAVLDLQIAGIGKLVVFRNRVDVRSGQLAASGDTRAAGAMPQRRQQLGALVRT